MRVIASAVLAALPVACGESLPSDEALLAHYPAGGIFNSLETLEMQVDCPVPEFLFGSSPQLARGVSIPFGERNPDGGRPVHRWGQWHYFHVDSSKTIRDEDLTQERLAARGEFRDGQRVGPWEFWFPGGEVRARGSFVDGKMSGEWVVWRSPGVIDPANSGGYVDGVRSR